MTKNFAEYVHKLGYRLTACEVGVFLRNITTLEKVPTPLFEEPLKLIA